MLLKHSQYLDFRGRGMVLDATLRRFFEELASTSTCGTALRLRGIVRLSFAALVTCDILNNEIVGK